MLRMTDRFRGVVFFSGAKFYSLRDAMVRVAAKKKERGAKAPLNKIFLNKLNLTLWHN
jgi:hypothetical protein